MRIIYRESVEKDKSVDEHKKDFFAKFNLDNHMAYFVAKTLNMRPGEILDTWSYPELIVAYGHYANEISSKNYEEWKQLDSKSRGKAPKRYNVRFYEI